MIAAVLTTGFFVTVPAAQSNERFRLPAPLQVNVVYEGDDTLKRGFELGSLQPKALASGDFDEDGVPDLICGYADAQGDVLTLHRGNLDAIFPNGPAAQKRRIEATFTDSPFLPEARIFASPGSPDLLAAGDFDNDGHWDVVVATVGQDAVHLMTGDGHGSLGAAKRLPLPGTVTAMIAGEINRADGLADLVVGVNGPAGPAVLVFEGPQGAWNQAAEVLSLPAVASNLLLGYLDDGPASDLAIAAGHDLLIVQGRDRRLTLTPQQQAAVRPPVMERITLPEPIEAIAWGDFVWEPDRSRELALLSTNGTLHLWAMEDGIPRPVGQREVFAPVESDGGSFQARPVLLPTRISGSPTEDLMILDPVGGNLQVLAGMERTDQSADSPADIGVVTSLDPQESPVAVLPMRLNSDALDDLVLLDHRTSTPLVAESVAQATITVDTTRDDETFGDNRCTLREAINNANFAGDTTGGDCVAGGATNLIDFDISGPATSTIDVVSALPTVTRAVTIDGSTQGCASPPCIALNGEGAGASVDGLNISADGCTVRGLAIHGFTEIGIHVLSSGNIVEGNFIGTDLNGTIGLGNGDDGIELGGAHQNTIGGTVVEARNVISNNFQGIRMTNTSTGNLVQGNYIGTDVTGTAEPDPPGMDPPDNNNIGVYVQGGSANNTVGGTTAGARNVISANDFDGVRITSSSTNNLVQGNYIGTDISGTVALGNSMPGSCGTATAGVSFHQTASFNTLGGTVAGAGNIISGNNVNGISAITNAADNLVQGNFIGKDASGSADLGNACAGVVMYNDAHDNTVGGTTAGAGNLIANNGTEGVNLPDNDPQNTGNAVLGNSIYSNTTLGIDLGTVGVTPNDALDADLGANDLQNFPVLNLAEATASEVRIGGTLNSLALTTFRIEFFASTACDASGHGEGERFIGFSEQTTNASGNVDFSVTLPATVSDGEAITSTATSPNGNTSEFSACVGATACAEFAVFGQTITAADENSLNWTVNEDVRFVRGVLASVSSYAVTNSGTLLAASSLDISSDNPAAGNGLYYLVKPSSCGSWQTGPGVEPLRDATLP